MAQAKLAVSIIGATGYTGIELVGLLSQHPHVQLKFLTSESYAGKAFSECFPAFRGQVDQQLMSLSDATIEKESDLAFVCLPHHSAASTVADFIRAGLRVIDLSADFRIRDFKTYENFYGPHPCPELIAQAVYGLPELYKDQIKQAQLIANPGCYPTSAILAVAPLLGQSALQLDTLIFDSKSGVSGAGRKASVEKLFAEVNENFKAYGIGTHRHRPEIEQELSVLSKTPCQVTFTPHLLPVNRGILTTAYAQLRSDSSFKSIEQIHQAYCDFYQDQPFVDVFPLGEFPTLATVRYSNTCAIGIHLDEQKQGLTIISCIDNLIKGASGQAVQNMNLMFGFAEVAGLERFALYP